MKTAKMLGLLYLFTLQTTQASDDDNCCFWFFCCKWYGNGAPRSGDLDDPNILHEIPSPGQFQVPVKPLGGRTQGPSEIDPNGYDTGSELIPGTPNLAGHSDPATATLFDSLDSQSSESELIPDTPRPILQNGIAMPSGMTFFLLDTAVDMLKEYGIQNIQNEPDENMDKRFLEERSEFDRIWEEKNIPQQLARAILEHQLVKDFQPSEGEDFAILDGDELRIMKLYSGVREIIIQIIDLRHITRCALLFPTTLESEFNMTEFIQNILVDSNLDPLPQCAHEFLPFKKQAYVLLGQKQKHLVQYKGYNPSCGLVFHYVKPNGDGFEADPEQTYFEQLNRLVYDEELTGKILLSRDAVEDLFNYFKEILENTGLGSIQHEPDDAMHERFLQESTRFDFVWSSRFMDKTFETQASEKSVSLEELSNQESFYVLDGNDLFYVSRSESKLIRSSNNIDAEHWLKYSLLLPTNLKSDFNPQMLLNYLLVDSGLNLLPTRTHEFLPFKNQAYMFLDEQNQKHLLQYKGYNPFCGNVFHYVKPNNTGGFEEDPQETYVEELNARLMQYGLLSKEEFAQLNGNFAKFEDLYYVAQFLERIADEVFYQYKDHWSKNPSEIVGILKQRFEEKLASVEPAQKIQDWDKTGYIMLLDSENPLVLCCRDDRIYRCMTNPLDHKSVAKEIFMNRAVYLIATNIQPVHPLQNPNWTKHWAILNIYGAAGHEIDYEFAAMKLIPSTRGEVVRAFINGEEVFIRILGYNRHKFISCIDLCYEYATPPLLTLGDYTEAIPCDNKGEVCARILNYFLRELGCVDLADVRSQALALASDVKKDWIERLFKIQKPKSDIFMDCANKIKLIEYIKQSQGEAVLIDSQGQKEFLFVSNQAGRLQLEKFDFKFSFAGLDLKELKMTLVSNFKDQEHSYDGLILYARYLIMAHICDTDEQKGLDLDSVDFSDLDPNNLNNFVPGVILNVKDAQTGEPIKIKFAGYYTRVQPIYKRVLN